MEIDHAPMLYFPKFFKSLDSYWLYRSIRGKLFSYKQQDKLDLIDAHFGYPDGAGCVRAGRDLGVPVFITVRGVEENYFDNPSVGRGMRDALRQADGCICVSHSLAIKLMNEGIDIDRTRVIHNAVDRNKFRPAEKSSARQALDIPASRKIIVSVGNLLSVKRHDILIRAFSSLAERQPHAHLVIIGGAMHEPAHPQYLKKLARELRIADRVTFAGKLEAERVARWLNAADVFALASEREGCCNALLEALASGLPAVVTDVGDNGRFVRPGDNGYLASVGDSESMAELLILSLESEAWDRDRISSNLRVGDWDAVASQVIDFMAERIDVRNGVTT